MTKIRSKIFSMILWIMAAVAPVQVLAETLLTVTHDDVVTEYDLAALEALGAVTVETSTIWTDGVQTFTGVPLTAFADLLEIEDGVFLASAINDYTVEIPVSDAVAGGPIIAFLNDGKPMSIRDKGPLWVIYPYDSNPDYQAEVIYSRSIWQLDRIETRN